MPFSVDNATRLAMPLAIELCKDHPYYAFGDTLWRIGTLLCIVLGMPGHILVVTIMLNPRNRRQPVCLYFATIAVFEFAYLSILFWLWCSSLALVRDPRDILTCGTYYTLLIGSSSVSTLLLTTASIDRVLIVIYPSLHSTFVTRAKALLKICAILVFIVLLMIQYRLSFDFSRLFHVCEYYSYVQLWHGKLWPLIRLSLLVFVPCTVTCACSFFILQNRFYRRPSTTSETTGTRHMRTASLLLVVYSIYYTLTLMPLNILQFFHSFFLDETRVARASDADCLKFAQWKLLMKLGMFLMAVNYSNKFLVHYLISLQFRRDAWSLLTKCTFIPDRYSKRARSIEVSSYR